MDYLIYLVDQVDLITLLEALEGQVLIVEGEHRGSHFLVRRYLVRGDDSPGGASGPSGAGTGTDDESPSDPV